MNLIIGKKVITHRKIRVPKGALSDSARDMTFTDLPKGTSGEIVGVSQKPKMYKVEIHGGIFNGKFFWLKGLYLRLAN